MALSKVYDYWFDNSIQNIQRHWIPISAADTLKKINTIEREFMSIYLNCLFKAIHVYNTNLDNYCEISIKNRISMVILLDQFTRTLGKKYKNIKKIKKICSELCLRLVNDFVTGKFLKLKPDELIFVLMIYKHIDYKYFSLVNDIVNIYCKYNEKSFSDKDMCNLQRFYLDFYKKYVYHSFPSKEIMNMAFNDTFKFYKFEYYRDVCIIDGYLPTDFPYTLYNTSLDNSSMLEKTIYNVFYKKIEGDICVSISGGVDSMVLVFILKKLEKLLNINLCAFNIIYNNREESNIEKDLIWAFCKKIDVPFYTYKIDYVKRGNINRESYETITRDIRFNCYKKFNCPIALGHIEDDKIENVITNFSTNKHMFDLKKIHLSSIIDGVTILRPFIDIEKKHIIDYSYKNKIPYLNNTTPYWSNRGKFRKDFLPAFTKQYGEIGIKNVLNFAETLNNYGEIIEENIIIPSVEKLIDREYFKLGEKLLNNSHLVREIFKRYSHSKGHSMPSEKSIKNLIKAIKSGKTKKYELSKNIKIEIENFMIKCI